MKRLTSLAGFTLIEVLVVMLIISIVTSVALLTINRNENREIDAFANEFTQVLSLAEEQAMLQPAVLRVTFKEHSFQFASLQKANDQEQKEHWLPLSDNELGHHRIPDHIEIALKQHQASAKEIENNPQIIISTNGDVTPFTIYIGKRGAKPRYVITGDSNGHIESQLLS
jgi:general secretion pathway protein H